MPCDCKSNIDVGVVVGIVKLSKKVSIPLKGTTEAACFDLKAHFWNDTVKIYDDRNGLMEREIVLAEEFVTLYPGWRCLVPTGISLSIPHGYCVKVYPRSGISTKKGLNLINNVGIIDSDYSGELLVPIVNTSNEAVIVAEGDRIAQFMLEKVTPCYLLEMKETDAAEHFANSDRAHGDAGGFGSTGT